MSIPDGKYLDPFQTSSLVQLFRTQLTWESNKIQSFIRSWRPILFEGRFSYHIPMQPDKTDRYRWNIGLFSNLPIAQ